MRSEIQQLNLKATKKYYKGEGCEHCLNTGYRGRTVLSELLIINNEIRSAIEENKTEQELKKLAEDSGFKSFEYDAAYKIGEGITSVEEVLRVLKL